jgi:hypothetical protein
MLISLFNWFIHLNNPIVAVLLIALPFIIAGYIEINREKACKIGRIVYDKESKIIGRIDGEIDMDGTIRLTNDRGTYWYTQVGKLRRLTPKERFDYYVQSL